MDRDYDINKKLTEREIEVLNYAKYGLTNREIAKKMMITHHTVKAHIASIMRKFGGKNRFDIVFAAVEQGLISLRQD